jgi:hypothetical protein
VASRDELEEAVQLVESLNEAWPGGYEVRESRSPRWTTRSVAVSGSETIARDGSTTTILPQCKEFPWLNRSRAERGHTNTRAPVRHRLRMRLAVSRTTVSVR